MDKRETELDINNSHVKRYLGTGVGVFCGSMVIMSDYWPWANFQFDCPHCGCHVETTGSCPDNDRCRTYGISNT